MTSSANPEPSSEGRDIDYSTGRSLLIVGDDDAARARCAAAALAAGFRIAAEVGLEEAIDRLDRQALTGGVIVEIDREPNEPALAAALERLLARLNENAAAGRYASVVSTPPALIDLVAALAPHSRIHQLCGANALERAAAIVIAATPDSLSFRDSSSESDSARLRQLTDEVGRIAGTLARLSANVSAAANKSLPGRKGAGGSAAERGEIVDSEEIRGMIRARRMRSQYFDAELFADPAWDMLLDLMAAYVDQQRVAVSSLCIAAAVPATTALRWIKTLTDSGLFVRRADPNDGRRVFIELGEDAARGMQAYLSAVKRLALAPGMNLAQVAI